MMDDEFFETQFPGSTRRLRDLCAEDEEFDRICADFQDLFAELTRPSGQVAAFQPRYLADLAESLSDLRSSIEARVQTPDPGKRARHGKV